MIGAFLAARGIFGLKNMIWIAIVAALIGAGIIAVKIAGNALDTVVENAEETGATKAISAGQNTTLEQIGKANEAGNEIRNDAGSDGGGAKFDECLRNVQPYLASNCERYRQNKPVPGGPRFTPAARP